MRTINPLVFRYIFSADGKYLLGGKCFRGLYDNFYLILAGMMIGDTSDYVKLVAIVKKKARSA